MSTDDKLIVQKALGHCLRDEPDTGLRRSVQSLSKWTSGLRSDDNSAALRDPVRVSSRLAWWLPSSALPEETLPWAMHCTVHRYKATVCRPIPVGRSSGVDQANRSLAVTAAEVFGCPPSCTPGKTVAAIHVCTSFPSWSAIDGIICHKRMLTLSSQKANRTSRL